MNPKSDEEILEMDVRCFLESELKSAISDEYLNDICHAIRDEVLWDVKETSAWSENRTWNDDDIKLAVGRVLMKKLGLEC
jgi:hypothetical protein